MYPNFVLKKHFMKFNTNVENNWVLKNSHRQFRLSLNLWNSWLKPPPWLTAMTSRLSAPQNVGLCRGRSKSLAGNLYSKNTSLTKVPFRRKRLDNIFILFFNGHIFLCQIILVSPGQKLRPNHQYTQSSNWKNTEITVFIPNCSYKCFIITQNG